jgi:hypothetical protein
MINAECQKIESLNEREREREIERERERALNDKTQD